MYQKKEYSKIKPTQKRWLIVWLLVFIFSLMLLPGCATQCVKEPVRQIDDITGYA